MRHAIANIYEIKSAGKRRQVGQVDARSGVGEISKLAIAGEGVVSIDDQPWKQDTLSWGWPAIERLHFNVEHACHVFPSMF